MRKKWCVLAFLLSASIMSINCDGLFSPIARSINTINDDSTLNHYQIAAIYKIIKAFKSKDVATINSFIDPSIGFYVIPGAGTLRHFDKRDSIKFSDADINYHQFGTNISTKFKIIETNSLPQYNCDTYKWNKYGLFVSKEILSTFSSILDGQGMGGQEVDTNDIKIANKIDAISRTVLLSEYKSDIIFGFAIINGEVVLTFLDLQETYCDI